MNSTSRASAIFCAMSRSLSSWLRISAARAGTSISAAASSASRLSPMAPRARAAPIARQASTVNCVVKALVEATPISGPASVCSTASDSRAMALSGALTMERIFCPSFFA